MLILKAFCLCCILWAIIVWLTETKEDKVKRYRTMYGTSYKQLAARFGLTVYRVRKVCLA